MECLPLDLISIIRSSRLRVREIIKLGMNHSRQIYSDLFIIIASTCSSAAIQGNNMFWHILHYYHWKWISTKIKYKGDNKVDICLSTIVKLICFNIIN